MIQNTTDVFQLVCVDTAFRKNLINMRTGTTYLLCKPSHTQPLFLEFFPNTFSDVHNIRPTAL